MAGPELLLYKYYTSVRLYHFLIDISVTLYVLLIHSLFQEGYANN